MAVLSAAKYGSLLPLCVYAGDATAHIARWLTAHNVTLLRHELQWRQQLLDKSRAHHAVCAFPPGQRRLRPPGTQRTQVQAPPVCRATLPRATCTPMMMLWCPRFSVWTSQSSRSCSSEDAVGGAHVGALGVHGGICRGAGTVLCGDLLPAGWGEPWVAWAYLGALRGVHIKGLRQCHVLSVAAPAALQVHLRAVHRCRHHVPWQDYPGQLWAAAARGREHDV